MAGKFTYKVKDVSAAPRTGRMLEGTTNAIRGNNTIISSGANSGVTSHSQLSGIMSTVDDYSEFARDIHLTATDADALKRLSTLEIIKLEDKTEPSDSNLFSALRTLEEIRKKIEDNTVVLDKRYLRKDIDDIAQGNITFDKNIFVGGEAGLTNALIVEALYSDIHAADFDVTGFHISAEGDAWLNNIYAKKDSYFVGNLSSPNFSSGFPAGTGWAITWRDVVNAAGVIAKKTHLEIDDATFRGV